MKKSEELTKLAIEIAGLRTKAAVWRLWDVRNLLEDACNTVLVEVRMAIEEERDSVRERSEEEAVEV